jgi:replicative DNA helicase
MHNDGIHEFDVHLASKIAKELGYKAWSVEYFDALFNDICYKKNIDIYIDKLLDDSTKFKLFTSLHNNIELVYSNAKEHATENSDSLINSVQADILDLSISSSAIDEPQHVSDGIDEYIKSIQDHKVELMGVSTGYPILDKAIDGLVPTTLTVIAARKKMGKSALLTNIAVNAAVKNGLPVLYIDTEMSFKEWRDRVLSIISGVDERVIKHGGFKGNAVVYDRIMAAVEYLKDSKLFHYYLPGYTVEKVSALYKKYKIKENIQLAIFDYIKEPDLTGNNRKEHQLLGDVTTKLKDLSGSLDIPFLAAVQLSRANDVADSDRIARYADVIAFWGIRDAEEAEENGWDLEESGFYGLSIKDSRRGGRTGKQGIGFHFYKTKLRIIEASPDKQIEHFNERVDVGDINV